jgi:hypothetical protein
MPEEREVDMWPEWCSGPHCERQPVALYEMQVGEGGWIWFGLCAEHRQLAGDTGLRGKLVAERALVP